jgi:hypothetical protein
MCLSAAQDLLGGWGGFCASGAETFLRLSPALKIIRMVYRPEPAATPGRQTAHGQISKNARRYHECVHNGRDPSSPAHPGAASLTADII